MAATTLLTSDQFLAMPEELDQYGNYVRHELIRGELVGSPAPSQRDAIIRSNILEALLAYLHANPAVGFKVLSRSAFVVSPSCVFIPDVALLVRSRLNNADRSLQGAPDLAIEVISPTDLEVQLKRKIDAYLSHGSKSVWVVYPEARSIMLYRADAIHNLNANQSITDPLLPAFSSPVVAFFHLT